MPKYRLKTEALDAVQYTGEPAQAETLVAAMFTNVVPQFETTEGTPVWTGKLEIKTADGIETVEPGDYIMTRPDNSRFRVTASDFIALYEPIPES